MKTKSFCTNLIRKHRLYTMLVSGLVLLCCSAASAGNIVNISSIKVSKDYPASFVLSLESNDIVTINYGKNSGKADLQQLEVRIIDLNQQEEEVINTFKRSGRDFLAKYDGNYRVDFIYTGKGSGIFKFKERSLDLNVKMELDGYDGLKEGEYKEVLHATNVVIEEGENSALKIVYYLTKGDKITISSTDKKSAFLKLNITQQPKILSVSGSTEINITSDGTYTFNFYLDENDDGGGILNLRDLLAKDDVLFRDLSIYRERAVDFSKVVASSSTENRENNSGSEDLLGGSNSLDTDEADNGIDIEKILLEANKGSEEFNNALLETIKNMQESMNKKTVRTTVSSIPNSVQVRLEPELNFSSKNGNRKCELIILQPTQFDIWFYWMGVGENAEEAYNEHDDKMFTTYKKSFSDLAAEHIYGKFGNPELGRKSPRYPDEAEYSHYLNEDAEYAIVNTENMLKFMRGERFSKLNQPSRNSKYVTSDNGISGKASDDGDMFFCACNNNKATPVEVFFKFIAIDYEENEY